MTPNTRGGYKTFVRAIHSPAHIYRVPHLHAPHDEVWYVKIDPDTRKNFPTFSVYIVLLRQMGGELRDIRSLWCNKIRRDAWHPIRIVTDAVIMCIGLHFASSPNKTSNKHPPKWHNIYTLRSLLALYTCTLAELKYACGAVILCLCLCCKLRQAIISAELRYTQKNHCCARDGTDFLQQETCCYQQHQQQRPDYMNYATRTRI